MNTLCLAVLSCLLFGYGTGFVRRDTALIESHKVKRADPIPAGGAAPPAVAAAAAPSAVAAASGGDDDDKPVMGAPVGYESTATVGSWIATPFAYIVNLIALLLRSLINGIGSLFGGTKGKQAADELNQALTGTQTALTQAADVASGVASQASGAVSGGQDPPPPPPKTAGK